MSLVSVCCSVVVAGASVFYSWIVDLYVLFCVVSQLRIPVTERKMYSLRVCNILRNGALKSEVAVRGFAISSVHNDNHKYAIIVHFV